MAADQSRGHGQKQAEWRRPGTFRETCLARAERGQTGASPEQPVHGHPLLFMGARDRTEVRNLKRQWSAYYFSSSLLRSAGGRWGACICTVGAVRSGSLQNGRRLSCGGWGGPCVLPSCCRYNSRRCRRRSGPSFARASCTTRSRILVSLANLCPYTPLARH